MQLGIAGQLAKTLCSTNPWSRWCATRRHVKGENGRTTLIRAGWKTGPGRMQRPGEAGGSRSAGSRAGGGSSPDNVAAGRHCQTPACALARPKGRAKAKRWSKPLDRISSPEPGGCGLLAAMVPLPCLAARAGPGSSIRARWPEGDCDCPPDVLQGYSRLPTRSNGSW